MEYTKEDLEQMELEDFIDRKDDIFSVLNLRLSARRLVNQTLDLYYIPCITEGLQIKNYYYFFGKQLVLNVECVDRDTTLALLEFHKKLGYLKARQEFFDLAHRFFEF